MNIINELHLEKIDNNRFDVPIGLMQCPEKKSENSINF